MRLYNYTSLKNREAKIYNVGGYNLAGGMSIEFLKVVGPFAGIGIVLGMILGLPFGFSFFNIFSENFHWQWTVLWLALGIGTGCCLWYIQFAGYRLYQYLAAYFKPKKVYMNDFKNTQFKLTTIKFKGFVKNIL
jgi:hypothetical protein